MIDKVIMIIGPLDNIATDLKNKKLKLQYPTVTARLHAEIKEKITFSFEVKKFSKSKIFKVENIFKVD